MSRYTPARAAAPPRPVVVWADGRRYTLTCPPTAELLDVLGGGRLGELLPGRLPTGQTVPWYLHLLSPAEPLDMDDAAAIALAAAGEWTAMPGERALAIAGWAAAEWQLIDGHHLGRGVDLLQMTPARLFAALWAWLIEHRFAGKTADAEAALTPATSTAPITPVPDPAADAAAFSAALAAAGSLDGISTF